MMARYTKSGTIMLSHRQRGAGGLEATVYEEIGPDDARFAEASKVAAPVGIERATGVDREAFAKWALEQKASR